MDRHPRVGTIPDRGGDLVPVAPAMAIKWVRFESELREFLELEAQLEICCSLGQAPAIVCYDSLNLLTCSRTTRIDAARPYLTGYLLNRVASSAEG